MNCANAKQTLPQGESLAERPSSCPSPRPRQTDRLGFFKTKSGHSEGLGPESNFAVEVAGGRASKHFHPPSRLFFGRKMVFAVIRELQMLQIG
jgi:hypothetical protein